MAPDNIAFCTRCFTGKEKGTLHIHEYSELCDECNDALYPKNKEKRIDAQLIHKPCKKRTVLREVSRFDQINIHIGYMNGLAIWCNTCRMFVENMDDLRQYMDSERCNYM